MHHLFLDESGDHSLTHIDCGYPVFVLGGILVVDDLGLATLERSVAAFKYDFFGDPGVVLHTADITRNRRGFERLADPQVRGDFHRRLNALLASLEFSVVACVIRKRALVERHGELAVDPYMLSLGVVVERFCFELGGAGPQGHIHVERRNPRLDRELAVAWDLLRLNGTRYLRPEVLRRRIAAFDFVTKATGGGGLEIADLVVTPLGRWVAGMPPRPDLDVVRAKLRRGPKGGWEGAGLVVLPKEDGRGPLRNTRPRPV
jgi:hypothetical protein